jgi:hypothetical protein
MVTAEMAAEKGLRASASLRLLISSVVVGAYTGLFGEETARSESDD